MKPLPILLVLTMLVPAGTATARAQSPQTQLPQPVFTPPPPPAQRRAQLELELMQRFVQRSSVELGLNPQARNRLQRFLENGEQQRRLLAREGAELQQRLQSALQNAATSDAEFDQIIDRLGQIRQRELMLWRREQQTLREFLTPRQRAQFVALRSQFNETVQEIRTRPGP